jgi:hypothetical protein
VAWPWSGRLQTVIRFHSNSSGINGFTSTSEHGNFGLSFAHGTNKPSLHERCAGVARAPAALRPRDVRL